jgi:hypothetical protein
MNSPRQVASGECEATVFLNHSCRLLQYSMHIAERVGIATTQHLSGTLELSVQTSDKIISHAVSGVGGIRTWYLQNVPQIPWR